MITDQDQVQYLNFLCRTYDGVNKLIVATKTRIQNLNPEAPVQLNDIVQGMESQKGKISRQITKQLDFWPIWSEWMKGVPGVGSTIAGHLILLYYYRFTPQCQDCGAALEKKNKTFWCPICDKGVKGDGNLKYKIELKDFPMVSSWWHYMGRHVKDGKVPKRAKGIVSDWSTPGRQIGYQIGQSFIKMKSDHLYRAYYDKRRVLRDKTHPDASKMHKMNMCLNETIKMFLSHFWQVARTLDGLPTVVPYIIGKDPVHKVIKPFYWEGDLREAA
ncbi:MAG: hypothetical protein SV375_13705 [Thermodesulfobacteriota bacterium]|nr:hypothetical protein [Thermodesulfobacteriota bacterium]